MRFQVAHITSHGQHDLYQVKNISSILLAYDKRKEKVTVR
jgi:hypothetical protein